MLYIFKTKNMYTDSVLPSLYMTVEKKKFPCKRFISRIYPKREKNKKTKKRNKKAFQVGGNDQLCQMLVMG